MRDKKKRLEDLTTILSSLHREKQRICFFKLVCKQVIKHQKAFNGKSSYKNYQNEKTKKALNFKEFPLFVTLKN